MSSCFICKEKCIMLLPDRAESSQTIRDICSDCLDKFLYVYPTLFRKIRNRELGLKPKFLFQPVQP